MARRRKLAYPRRSGGGTQFTVQKNARKSFSFGRNKDDDDRLAKKKTGKITMKMANHVDTLLSQSSIVAEEIDRILSLSEDAKKRKIEARFNSWNEDVFETIQRNIK